MEEKIIFENISSISEASDYEDHLYLTFDIDWASDHVLEFCINKVEEAEIKVIDSFLPKQLSDEETKKICKEIIKSLGASSLKDMGKIMGSLKQKYSDSIDFSKVNLIVKGLLSQ